MDISRMNLDEIIRSDHKEYLDMYLDYFEGWLKLGFIKDELQPYYGKSIASIDPILIKIYEQGNIHYYKNVKEVRSIKIRNCSFCGDKIRKGKIYYRYHPFIIKKNKQEQEIFVLKKSDLFICDSCSNLIPDTYEELIGLKEQLELENLRDFYGEINFDFLKERVGEELEFQTLRKKLVKTKTFF